MREWARRRALIMMAFDVLYHRTAHRARARRAIMNCHTAILRALLAAGAAATVRDSGGNTLMLEAASAGCVDAIDVLLGAGASLDTRVANAVGRNPLHAAAIAGHEAFVGRCLEVRCSMRARSAASGAPLVVQSAAFDVVSRNVCTCAWSRFSLTLRVRRRAYQRTTRVTV